ncbi:MAG: phage holin family protein [Cyanobacteria bacterium P01_A01_bin.45]
MLGYFFTVLATALSLLVVDIALSGVNISSFPVALIAGVTIGLVNSFIKPILSVLSLPLNLLSLGLFSLVVNGFCFWLASVLTPGFAVQGLVAFIIGPIILSVVSSFLNNYFVEKNPKLNTDS